MFRQRRLSDNQRERFSIFSIFTLASWRWRQNSFMLCITTLGIIAAIVIVCTVPIFAAVMDTAGLRNSLNATPASAEVEVNTNVLGLSTGVMSNVRDQLSPLLTHTIGGALKNTQFSIISSDFSIATPAPPQKNYSLLMYGAEMQQAVSHLGHIQGRLAQPLNDATAGIEVMLSQESARQLGLQLGSTLPVQISFYASTNISSGRDRALPVEKNVVLLAHVVGIFAGSGVDTTYWHGGDFKPLTLPDAQSGVMNYTFSFITSNESLLALSDRENALNHTDAFFSSGYGYTMRWYYSLDSSHISIDDLDTLVSAFSNLADNYNANFGDLANTDPRAVNTFPYLSRLDLNSPLISTSTTPSNLESFSNRVDVARIPVAIMAILIIVLILFFVSLMTSLLVERQVDANALLRSRGASSNQIFGALLTQCIGLGIFAVCVGVPLALVAVILLTQRILPRVSQDALNIVYDHIPQVIQTSLLYAVGILLVILLTMSLSLFSAARMDVLSLRRDGARSSRRPLWQRLNLDVIAGVVAVAGYLCSLYLTSIGNILQGDAKALITAPLSIIAPFFLIIAFMLFFLRLFPLLLRLAAMLVARRRGAVSMLALAQIARSPRQAVRMTMLLALATSFAFFTLVYTATENQHVQEIATYQIGADFSGALSSNSSDIAGVSHAYKAIPGMRAVSTGFIANATGGHAGIPLAVRAIDATTFSAAVVWPSQTSMQSMHTLLTQLVAKRGMATATEVLPAIIDSSAATRMLMHVGAPFDVQVLGLGIPTIHCIVQGIVPYIPSVNNRIVDAHAGPVPGGLVIDYQTYAAIYAKELNDPQNTVIMPDAPTLNQIWMHTADDTASVNHIRTALNAPALHLNNLVDRRAFLAELNTDPFYLVLTGVLSIGTITALLLAFLGDLLASWLSARTRLSSFAILRAIGTTTQEVASMLTWEQAIVYTTGLLLGVAFGTLLSMTVIPSLNFTDLNMTLSSNQFYALQAAFPTQVVIPSTLFWGLVVLVGIYAIMLTIMVRVVSQPDLSQSLRLNQD